MTRILYILVTVSLMPACSTSKSSHPAAEAAPSPVSVAAKQQQLAALPPPQLDQVRQAITRVFKDSVYIDSNQQSSFIAGDFNGDLSQDIAVIVKPATAKVSDLNQDNPTWITRDLLKPDTKSGVQFQSDELLLAIIHGYGADGWRDSQATQTFLLKNAVGSNLNVQAGKAFLATNAGKNLPRIHGDLLSEVLRGTAGYLYYSGPTYAWYDPKSFKGEPQLAAVHGAK